MSARSSARRLTTRLTRLTSGCRPRWMRRCRSHAGGPRAGAANTPAPKPGGEVNLRAHGHVLWQLAPCTGFRRLTPSPRTRFSLRVAPYLVWLTVFAGATTASAHPMGNFSINHYASLRVEQATCCSATGSTWRRSRRLRNGVPGRRRRREDQRRRAGRIPAAKVRQLTATWRCSRERRRPWCRRRATCRSGPGRPTCRRCC